MAIVSNKSQVIVIYDIIRLGCRGYSRPHDVIKEIEGIGDIDGKYAGSPNGDSLW